MKYVAYYRLSKESKSKTAKSAGLSLEAQEEIVNHYYGSYIDKSFTEIKSGKNITERVILQEALSYCKKYGYWLVVAKQDRLSRDVIDCLTIFKELGGKVSFCDIPAAPFERIEKMILTFFSAVSERERELISLRTSVALQRKLKRDGKWQTPNPIFSNGEALRLSAESLNEKALSNENNIRASELICSKVKEGLNYNQIAQVLNQKKFKTSKGGQFQAIQVKRIYDRFCAAA